MKSSSKVLIGVGLGLVAGGVVGYLLNTDEGRELQEKAKIKANELRDDATEAIKVNSEIATEKASELAASSKEYASSIAETVKAKLNSTTETAENLLEDVKDEFQSGADKARTVISQKARKVADIVDKENV